MTLIPEQAEQLKRIRSVTDMLCTGHAILRDRYGRRALVNDIATLAFSTWVVALAFVSPEIAARLTPRHVDPTIWLGVLSTGTFFLTLVQMKTDWKSKADTHKRTLDLYAEVKRESGYLLASDRADDVAYRRVLDQYDMASNAGVEIPEMDFLALKRRHKIKVELSKYLDDHPSASIRLHRMRMWLRDNRAGNKK
jgi:hypothetical protein